MQFPEIPGNVLGLYRHDLRGSRRVATNTDDGRVGGALVNASICHV